MENILAAHRMGQAREIIASNKKFSKLYRFIVIISPSQD